MTVRFSGLAIFALCAFTCLGQEDAQINFSQLRTNCVAEIERGGWYGYTTLRDIKVLDYKMLAWHRTRDARPHYCDRALCWAKVTTDHGVMWAVAHMATNPKAKTKENTSVPWTLAVISDTPADWLLFFVSPPKNNDIYSKISFKFRPEEGFEMYDSQVLTNSWEAAIGEKPAKTFSNQTVQRTGASSSASETNRTSSAAGSRR